MLLACSCNARSGRFRHKSLFAIWRADFDSVLIARVQDREAQATLEIGYHLEAVYGVIEEYVSFPQRAVSVGEVVCFGSRIG